MVPFPVIDNKVLSNEFKKLKKISGYLRKVRPQDSVGNIYLNRKESQIIRKYEKEKADFLLKTKEKGYITRRRNLASSADNIKLSPFKTTNKLYKMPEDAQCKLQETLERIINEGTAGLICIIL